MNTHKLIDSIFNINAETELNVIEDVYAYQYHNNAVYQQWCDILNLRSTNYEVQILDTSSQNINSKLQTLSFLPISFFKSHSIKTTDFIEQQIFESSGTTQTINCKHFIKDVAIYKQSFLKGFELMYGDIKDWCIIGLLPNYLERNNSSLVYMVDELVRQSNHEQSGFYLYDFQKLATTLQQLEAANKKTLIIGVTFALLDFSEQFPMQLKHTTIMETGGMKGRKKEMTKDEIHAILKKQFGVDEIHSEYGMTELLSQAYSTKNEKHICPPWMKVFVRDDEDPLQIKAVGKGVINIIDLVNIYSCSFIATDDVGEVFEDGSFKIYGRLDNSDLRGCSLMYF